MRGGPPGWTEEEGLRARKHIGFHKKRENTRSLLHGSSEVKKESNGSCGMKRHSLSGPEDWGVAIVINHQHGILEGTKNWIGFRGIAQQP